MAAEPFTINIPDSVLDDLKARLERTRWPDELPGTEWDYGTNMTYLKELVEYWKTSFDWRAQEKLINSFSHFKADVDGLGIHFIHEKGKGPNPIPLIITHGWPGTFFEMHKAIPLLADPASHGGDPADAFDVVAPSMPGYGFSDAAAKRGMDVLSVGDVMAKLMTGVLGYQRFGAQGGDWGASVTAKLGYSYPENVIGIHSTSVVRPTPYMGPGSVPLTEAEEGLLKQREDWLAGRGRLLAYPRHQASDAGLRPERLTGRAGELDRGEVPELERLRRRRRVPVHQGRAADHSHHLLGHPDHQLRHPPLLRNAPQTLGPGPRRRHQGTYRSRRIPGRDQPPSQGMGGAVVQRAAMDSYAQRRPLRRLGGAATIGGRRSRFLQAAAVTREV